MRKITNKDLVKLGFPDVIAKNTYYWGGKKYAGTPSYVKAVVNRFYVTTKALIMIYNKKINDLYTVTKKDEFTVYLNNKRIFYFDQSWRHTYKKQDLARIKGIIKELLNIFSFDELADKVKKLSKEIMLKMDFYYFLEEKGLFINLYYKTELKKEIREIIKKYDKIECIPIEYNNEEWNFGKKHLVDKKEILNYFKSKSYVYLLKDCNMIIMVKKGSYIAITDKKVVNELIPVLILHII